MTPFGSFRQFISFNLSIILVGLLFQLCYAQQAYPLHSEKSNAEFSKPIQTMRVTDRTAAEPEGKGIARNEYVARKFGQVKASRSNLALDTDGTQINDANNPFSKSFAAAYQSLNAKSLDTQLLPKFPSGNRNRVARNSDSVLSAALDTNQFKPLQGGRYDLSPNSGKVVVGGSNSQEARRNEFESGLNSAAKPSSILSLNSSNDFVISGKSTTKINEPSGTGNGPAKSAFSLAKQPSKISGSQEEENPELNSSWEINIGGNSVWWKDLILKPIHSPADPQGIDSNSLVYETLKRSPRIYALSQDPLIRELQIVEASADFDPVRFMRSQFQDRVDPVGDLLSVTDDGSAFMQDHIWNADIGIRKKATNGALVEVDQKLGFKNSNSEVFKPEDQGTATLAINVTQPLLRGRGKLINQSQILIAQSASGGAWNTFVGELQDEIQSTVDGYWRLYYDRSVYLQKRRNVDRGEAILRTLEGRRELDSLPSQIARARSAVQSRKTDLANALRDIRDSETELRRLTADRNWQANQNVEMIPTETPNSNAPQLELEQVVFTALENRPEIKEAISRSKIAGVQENISENELLPELSLLMGTYVSALEGESRLGDAWVDQFGGVKPGYSVGVEFELPMQNRAARSRHAQRQLQLAKIKAEVDEVMQNVIAESQVSLRRVDSAKETTQAAYQAIFAARADLEQNFRRWESFALVEGDLADGQTPTTILDQLLDSQERLTAAELVYSQAELELKSAEVGLLRSMGTLLIHRNVCLTKENDGYLPSIQIEQKHNVNEEAPLEIPASVSPSFGFLQTDSKNSVSPLKEKFQAQRGVLKRIFK